MHRFVGRMASVCAAVTMAFALMLGATPASADVRSACKAQAEAAAAQIKGKSTNIIGLSPAEAVMGFAMSAMANAAEAQNVANAREETRNKEERACLAKHGLAALPGSSAACACAQVPFCTALTKNMTCEALIDSCKSALTTAEFEKYTCAKVRRIAKF